MARTVSVSWEEAAYDVSAGDVIDIDTDDDLDAVAVSLIAGTQEGEVYYRLDCRNYRYLCVRRRDDHEPGSGNILDAYLHTDSVLLSDFARHKLDALSGSIQTDNTIQWKHLEVIGEVSIDIICAEVSITKSYSWPIRRGEEGQTGLVLRITGSESDENQRP